MTLRRSEAILRLLIGLALAVGFVGFATHSHSIPQQHASDTPALVAPAAPSIVASGPVQLGL